MIVAPILAIASYYLVDLAFKEQPQQAVVGQAYKLLAKSNCRFSSGACDLENGNFKSTLHVSQNDAGQTLTLNANKPLQNVSVGFVTSDGAESGPFALNQANENGMQWSTEFGVPANASTTVRVALTANDAHYFSETTMGFSTYETSFDKDFRK